MPFSRENVVPYRPLESSKYVNGETDELCGSAQTDQNGTEDGDLVGYSLNFTQPKDNFVGQVKQSFVDMRGKVCKAIHFALSVVFGKWPFSLIILISYIALTVGLIVVSLTGKYHEFREDLSLDSFLVPDIKVSSDFAAFNAAQNQEKSASLYYFHKFLTSNTCVGNKLKSLPRNIRRRSKRSEDHPKSDDFQYGYSGSLDLVYVAKGGDNIFTQQHLHQVHEIEKTLMKHKNYDKHCYIPHKNNKALESYQKYGNCSPPLSLVDLFYSSDGQSDVLSRPINKTLQYLRSKEYFFSFVSDDFSKTSKSRILRAAIPFGKPLKGVEMDAEKDEFKRYLITYIETLEQLNNNNHVSILYGGGDLFDYLVNRALISDLHLAGTSLGLILLLLLLLTFSLWLSFMAVFTILSSVAFAYFFYHVVFGIKYMGILNGVSLFVIIGIGVDDIFVFINTFRQAVDNQNLGNRIVHTIHVAGKATFFTSFTTAAAFGANALSPIPAIHDFGVFMAVLVTSCWVSVVFIISPSLTLWHAGIEKLESRMFKKVLSVIGVGRSETLRLPDDIRRFLSGNPRDGPEEIPLVPSNTNVTSSNDNEDDDDNDGDDDEPLLVLDDESTSNQNIYARNPIGFRLQSILYHFVAEPVVKGRAVIFVICIFILAGSAVLVSKLQVSTDQPKFFKADSNLQRWLELPDVSLNRFMLKKIVNIGKHFHGRISPATRIPSTRNPQTTRAHKSKVPTSQPASSTTPKPLLPTRSPKTWPPTTTAIHKPEKPSVRTTSRHRTTTTEKPPVATSRTSTTETARVPTSATESTQPTVPGDTSITTDRPTTATTSSLNNSKSGCPHECSNGVCNRETGKCDCYISYTGETCSKYCPVRTMSGKCCFIPFTQNGQQRLGCLIDENTRKPWCSLTPTYHEGQEKEECNTTVADRCAVRTDTPNKTCCHFPFTQNNVEYYSCRRINSSSDVYCSTKRHVSSPADLKRCVLPIGSRTTTPPLCGPKECVPVTAPPNEATALVYLVFGIKGLDKSSVDLRHVLKQTEGKVIYDKVFSKALSCKTELMFKAACRICKKFSEDRELVKPGGAECFPDTVRDLLESKFDDCRNLPSQKSAKIKSILVIKQDPDRGHVVEWLAMAFSSTTGTLSSYGTQHDDYDKWEKQVKEVLSGVDIPDSLKHGFQTSETWVKMFSGIIVVNSAVYGIVVSLLLCLAAVMIFTGHALLFLILFLTILGVLLKVTAIFYLTGWQLGGVEAISLSILVGTSVDYCFHLVEGYILAGNAVSPTLDAKAARQWRAKAAMSHIGMSIISSAVTTILAAIPLCVTQIQLFAKFGLIVTINTGISLLYTVTVTMALLSIAGPSRFRASLRACGIALFVVLALGGLGVLILYLVSTKGGHCIEGPSGTPLFDCGK